MGASIARPENGKIDAWMNDGMLWCYKRNLAFSGGVLEPGVHLACKRDKKMGHSFDEMV